MGVKMRGISFSWQNSVQHTGKTNHAQVCHRCSLVLLLAACSAAAAAALLPCCYWKWSLWKPLLLSLAPLNYAAGGGGGAFAI
jgi:hypothetical protein